MKVELNDKQSYSRDFRINQRQNFLYSAMLYYLESDNGDKKPTTKRINETLKNLVPCVFSHHIPELKIYIKISQSEIQ